MKKAIFAIPLIALLLVVGCGKSEKPTAEMASADKPAETAERTEPERVEVQHILISFDGADPRIEEARSQEDSEVLAKELLQRAQAGEDFDALVKEYTNDSYPGIYRMANSGVEPDAANEEYPRGGMVTAFGDVSFSLEVGAVGMTIYSPENSKYGWHIIKRLK